MKLLTIGEFARAARLSPKALRLYDDLGLLRPHAVDKWSGYRYYSPDQLERARLVAWLRRLGMPLAQIGAVVDAPAAQAAALVNAFLTVSAAEFAERQRLAQFLVTYLSEGTPAAMTSSCPAVPLSVSYAAGSDRGLVRERNQDASYASPLLLAVADGYGPAGERASAAVMDALRGLGAPATTAPVAADVLNALGDAVAAAASAIRTLSSGDPAQGDSGSTLTAMYWAGSQLALVHIGDTRAYLLRDGGLFQLTHDDSVTQAMVDAGQLTPEEATSHPQRSLLLKAIGGFDSEVSAPALTLHDVRAGDRYLLSSDGLTLVVPVPVIREVLRDCALSPQDVVDRLIALANQAGGPDNIVCAVADIAEAA